MSLMTTFGNILKYGPTAIGLLAKHGPAVLALIREWGPKVVANAPAIAAGLRTAANFIEKDAPALLGQLNTIAPKVVGAAQLATTSGASSESDVVSSFVGNVVAAVPAARALEPHIVRQVQANADAAIRAMPESAG